jgi:hypothetical protein
MRIGNVTRMRKTRNDTEFWWLLKNVHLEDQEEARRLTLRLMEIGYEDWRWIELA